MLPYIPAPWILWVLTVTENGPSNRGTKHS